MIQSNAIRTHIFGQKNEPADYHFQFCGFLLKAIAGILYFCLHQPNLYVIVSQLIFSNAVICLVELWVFPFSNAETEKTAHIHSFRWGINIIPM